MTQNKYELGFTQQVWAMLGSMPAHERKLALRAVHWLAESPTPDGQRKRKLPFPHRPGTLGAYHGDLFVTYALQDVQITILNIQRRILDLDD